MIRILFLATVSVASLVAQGAGGSASRSELTPKRIVALEYPWFARMAVLQGKVEVLVTVNADGSVRTARAVFGPAPLGRAVEKALSQWVFNGCASDSAPCEVKLQFSFVLNGVCDASTHCPSEFEMELPDRARIVAKAFKAIVN